MKWVVDRIEKELAIVECGDRMFEVPVSLLPKEAREGSVIQLHLAQEDTDHEEAKALLKRLQERDTDEDSIDI